MVSPSKTKYSRVAANQQQKTASSNKVKLVKGPRPLIHHRFYLDIQRYQLANEIETTIKELGGQIEFFLNKEITHFITDKEYQQHPKQQQQHQYQRRGTESDSGHSSHHQLQHQQQRPVTPTTPQTPRTPLSYVYHPHLQQYVNEASPSSPCIGGTPNPTQPGLPLASGSIAAKPSIPRSRADAMLQRVRQQQQQYNSNNPSSAPPSPCSPAPGNNSGFRANQQSDRLQQSPAHLAKSWGKPIWTTEYAIKFFKKVIETCSASRDHDLQSLSSKTTSEAVRKPTNIQHLRNDFIKIESFQRHYRPAFQLFKKWPVLNLNARSSASPFNSNQRDRDRDRDRKSLKTAATAATTNQHKAAGTAAAAVTAATNTTTTTTNTNQTNARTKPTQQQQQRCGYCEICRIEYDVLANHLAAEEHSAFVKNDANFVALDKLIGEGGVDLKTFLEQNPAPEEEEQEEDDKRKNVEEPVTRKEEPSEQVRRDAKSEAIKVEAKQTEDTVVGKCEEQVGSEVKKKNKKEEDEVECEDENRRIVVGEKASEKQSPKVVRTYSRKHKDKNHILAPEDPAESHGSSIRSPPAKRTYAGRKQARRAAAAAAALALASAASPSPGPKPVDDEPPLPLSEQEQKEATPSNNPVDAHPPPEPSNSKDVSEAQMFGRRSAIYHHPHNTLNHHNHQKVKAARQLQQEAILRSGSSLAVPIPSSTAVPEEEEALSAEAMKVLKNEPIKNGPSEKEKERQSKRSAADRMGLKGSSLKSNVVHHPSVEMLECEGLDPKNTKRISLGLRQNPKRANLNEDFTSLLDETLGPMRKPRVRRESAKRVNYSEPREDEIASQEEIMQSILEKTAKEASEIEAKKKKPGSPKRPLNDVKIRGIQWRAPSPQTRPPVKSPLLYKVIEDPKPKNKKTASPTKDSREGGHHSKPNKNGLIVKIRRVRQSELSLLNDEAENFMFPKKDDSSDEETDEDRQTTSEMGPGDMSQDLPSSETDHRNSISMRKSSGTPTCGGGGGAGAGRKRTSSIKLPPPDSPGKKAAMDSDSEATPRSRRAGTRGPAALLQDNAEYYKFPDPGSRLRFPEAPIQPSPPAVEDEDNDGGDGDKPSAPRKRGNKRCRSKTPAPATMTSQKQQEHDILLATRSSPSSPYQHQEQLMNCGKTIINYVKGKEDGMGVFRWSNFRKNCKEIEPYRFAFERVPSLEPWYETFQRQDDCSEQVYEYFGNTAYRKLPYEMGPLPPLKQNCCILNYRMKSKSPEVTVPASTSSSSSSSSSTSSSCGHKATTATTAATTTTSTAGASDDKEPLALPLKKRKLLVDSDRPRKSPREHASTLAILSLLHQQQKHNRRRTISSGSTGLPPIVSTAKLPPPSPTPSSVVYSPKKAAIQAHHNSSQQEADSALGDEIRSSCGSDPVTEREEDHCGAAGKKIKFDPPVLTEDSFVNYKDMCQELDVFLSEMSEGAADEEDEAFFELKEERSVAIGSGAGTLRKNLNEIVRACDKEAPLSLKQVNRREGAMRKIVQYDRKPRPLSAVSIKSFDGGGSLDWTGRTVLFRKRINRTGWPNAKKRIVTRKQQQLQVKKGDGVGGEVKKEGDADGSRKSSTEESQISDLTADTSLVKQEDEDEELEEDDEFEDTMTMLDDEEPNGKVDTLLTDDEEEARQDLAKKAGRSKTPVPSKVEEVRSASRLDGRILPSSRYVTKTTTTMTRVDYNVPASSSSTSVIGPSSEDHPPVQNHTSAKGSKTASSTSCPAPVAPPEDDDKECDSISSRSIFVSDDCDTTSSTLINMQCTEDPLAIGSGSQRNGSATPQPQSAATANDEPSEQSRPPRPASRARQNTTRHLMSCNPVVRIEKLNCAAASTAPLMRTRSSSRTPIKKTYKRSIFTTSLVTSSGKPHKKKRKKKHKLNGVATSSGASNAGSPSPVSCSDELNSASSSLDCEDLSRDTPTPPRKSIKDRPPTPGPIKFSPRKLRKPRGRWYRER